MQNYNSQQQAVILKGIAQQILGMNVPTFYEALKLLNLFGVMSNQDSSYYLIDEGIKRGFIFKSGTWITYKGFKIGQINDNIISWDKGGKKLLFEAMLANEPNN